MSTTEAAASEAEPEAPAINWRTKIAPDPHRPGRDRWRLIEESIPIWAIIQDMIMFGHIDEPTEASPKTIAETADAFRISDEAVRAALAFYADYRKWIDARLMLNGLDDDSL